MRTPYNTFNRLNNQVYIFHYGGHSDGEFLHLSGRHARSESLATLMGQQKYLKLVFLNGCANRGQVKALFGKGVPAVIATSAPVGDGDARQLAEQFYKALAGGKTIREAFEAAASYVQNEKPELDIRYRGASFDEVEEDGFSWGLYAQEEDALDWHFGLVEQESNLEILGRLRKASKNRYQAFTDPGGRYQYLRIDEALLAGIENTRESEARKLIETRIGEDKTPLEQSLETLWQTECAHALLVGAGGMGKTVSLIQLWAHYLDAERANWPAPVFIPLNEFNNRPEKGFIRNYIREHYGGEDIGRLLKEPLLVDDARYPHLILLLDGFNEVTATSNELILEINELRAPDKYPGVQLVLSSRVDMRQAYQWQQFHLLELQALSDEQIEAFLKQPLPTDTRLLELLRNPMMLSIYAAQTELPQRFREKGLLKESVTSTGEMLFNVEMLQRIKIEELHFADLPEQAFRRFVLEHLLPSIGWQMQQAGLFFLEKEGQELDSTATGLGHSGGISPFGGQGAAPANAQSQLQLQINMEEALEQAIRECRNEEYFKVFPFFRKNLKKKRLKKKPWKLVDSIVDEVCCHGLALLVAEDGNYRFLHQNFRDYFAARYVQNKIEIALQQRVLPTVLKKAPLDFYVRHLLGELEGEHTNEMKWLEKQKKWQWSKGQFFIDNRLSRLLELCRGVFEKRQVGYVAWNILTIWKEQRGELSGADLRWLNFHSFSFNGLLFSRIGLAAHLSEGTLLEENLFLQGHSGGVRSVAYSPDKRRIVSGSHDNTTKIWDIQTGTCLLTLEGHSDWVSSVVYSSDGERIVSGSYDNTVKVWNAQTGTCLLTLKGHSGRVWSVVYSTDGRWIVSGSYDKTVKIWDAKRGECIFTLHDHSGGISSVACSSDGEQVIGGSSDNTVKVWNTQTGECLLTLQGHSGRVWSVAYSADGGQIISGSSDNTVKVWNAQTGECLLTLQGHSGRVSSVAYSPDKRRIVSGSHDNTTKVWDAQTGACLLTLQGHSDWVWSVAYSPDGRRIVSGSYDNMVKLWDVQTGVCQLTLRGHSEGVESVSYSPDGRRIVSGSDDKTAKVWGTQTGKCLLTLQGHLDWVWSVAYSPDGRRIVSGSDDHTAKVWDTQSGECLLILQGHLEGVESVAYSPDGRRVVSGSEDHTVKVWNAQTGECLLTLHGHSSEVWSVAYSPDGRLIASGSEDHTIKVWDAQTGACLLTLHGHSSEVWSVAYSPDGRQIVSGSSDNMAKLWDTRTGQCLLTLHEHSGGVKSVSYSSDGERIVSGSNDNTIKVWDAQSGECFLTLRGHSAGVWSVSYSPDGKRILSGSDDNTAKVWDAQTGECLQTLPNIPGLLIQGCDFRNLHPDSQLSEEAIALLRQYGGIFDDEDARRWEELMEKHFGIKGGST